MALSWVTNWRKRLLSRIYLQFRGTDLEPIVVALANEAQLLEDAWQAIARMWLIDPVTDDPESPLYGVGRGVQLDRLGRLLDQARAGAVDSTYRLYLHARVALLKSSGVPEDLYRVFTALFGGGSFTQERSDVDAITFRIREPRIPPVSAFVSRQFLTDANGADVRSVLEWSPTDDAHLFLFDIGPGFGSETDPTVGGALGGAA